MNSSIFVTFEQNITIVVLSCDKQMLFGKVPAAEDHDYGLSLTFAVYLSLRFRPLHTCPSPYKAGQEGEESDLRKISEGTPTSSFSSSTWPRSSSSASSLLLFLHSLVGCLWCINRYIPLSQIQHNCDLLRRQECQPGWERCWEFKPEASCEGCRACWS